MPKKEVVTASGVYALLIFPLMLYAVGDLGNELRSENHDNSTVSQFPSEVPMMDILNWTSECLERYSCSNDALMPIRGLKCNCDDLCELYDDCCHDYNRSSSVDGVLPSPELIDCTRLPHSFVYRFSHLEHVFVVTRCPLAYSDVLIRELCESSDEEFNSQPPKNLPVYGRKSKILYRNWYCAVCNEELDVVFWRFRKETDYAHKTLMDSSSEDVPRMSCSQHFTITMEVSYFDNPDGFSPRECLNSVRKCAENWTDQETVMRCEERLQRTAYVEEFYKYEYDYEMGDEYEMGLREWRVYRNPDCATCNYAEESKTSCSLEFAPRDDTSVSFHPSDSSGRRYDSGLPSIAYVMKVELETKTKGEELNVPLKLECERGTLYDRSAEICLEILCAEGSEREPNSHCTTVNATKELHSFTQSLNCTEFVRLNASEFTFFNNQAVPIHKNRSSYALTDYVIDSDYIYICKSYALEIFNETVRPVIPFQFDRIQGILSLVGSVISLIALFLLFVVYLIFPVLRNVPGKCVMCLDLSLFSALLLSVFVSNPGPVCFYLSAAMHYAFLASFCWMNVLSIDIYRTFASRMINLESKSTSKRFVMYSLYSWTFPAVITSICIILDIAQVDDRIRPHYGREFCWITNPTALIAFFLVPVAVLLTANFVLFAITACALRRSTDDSRIASKKSTSRKVRLFLHAKLSIIMGLPWALGYVANLTEWTALWYLFIVFNTMQGTFLCVSFVCTKRVFRLMKDCSPWGRSSISASNENQHRGRQTDSTELSSCPNQNAAKTF